MENTETEMVKMRVAELVFDFSIYPRTQISSVHVTELRDALDAGVSLPPIIVDKDSKRIVDGFHRVMAVRRRDKEKAVIEVVLVSYKNTGALIAAAIEANSQHGRALSVYEKTRCIILAEEAGVSRARVLKALHLTKRRAEELLLERVTADGAVMKRTMAHLAGKETTAAQRDYNAKRAGGMNQLFYINQVIALLETDSIDLSRESIVQALHVLRDLIEAKVSVVA